MRHDPRQHMGILVETPCGPITLQEAARDGDGSDGGSLDIAIVAELPSGGRVIVGELWASGIGKGGSRISIDPVPLGKAIEAALKRAA